MARQRRTSIRPRLSALSTPLSLRATRCAPSSASRQHGPVEESCYDRDESAAVVNCLSTLYYFHARRQAQWIAAAIDACADEEETPR